MRVKNSRIKVFELDKVIKSWRVRNLPFLMNPQWKSFANKQTVTVYRNQSIAKFQSKRNQKWSNLTQ